MTGIPNTTTTLSTDTAADMLGVSTQTIGRYIWRGLNGVRLDAIRGPGRAWRISVRSMAAFILHRDGQMVCPQPSWAFGDTAVGNLEDFATRLSLWAPPTRHWARLDAWGQMVALYTPTDEECEDLDDRMARLHQPH